MALSAIIVFALIAWLTYWASGKVGPWATA